MGRVDLGLWKNLKAFLLKEFVKKRCFTWLISGSLGLQFPVVKLYLEQNLLRLQVTDSEVFISSFEFFAPFRAIKNKCTALP